MVRINKNNLDSTELEKLFKQCAYILAPKEAKHAHLVLQEILGYEERVTMAKRVAVIVLLVEDVSNYKIGLHLKLSQSTVATIAKKLQSGEYSTILTTLGKNKTDYFKILDTLDSILHLGGILPHYNGIDRYKYSN
jgi:uncharacterized protein YerC